MSEMKLFEPLKNLVNIKTLKQLHGQFVPLTAPQIDEIIKEHPESDPTEFFDGNVFYDDQTGVKTTIYTDNVTNEAIDYTETFEDRILKRITAEKLLIINKITEIRFSLPLSQIQQKLNYFISELEQVKKSFDLLQLPYLSPNFKNQSFIILGEIDKVLRDNRKKKTDSSPTAAQLRNKSKKSYIAEHYPKKVKILYSELVSKGFIIDRDSQYQLFYDILNGQTPPEKDKRIKWNNELALRFFIEECITLTLSQETVRIGPKLFSFPDNKWVWVKSCFMKQDGHDFKYIDSNTKTLGKETCKEILQIIHNLNL